MTSFKSDLSPQILRAELQRFWDEQLEIEPMRSGFAVALPINYPDGWQIVVEIKQFAPAVVQLSDGGRTLKRLAEVGMSFDSRAKCTYELLKGQKEMYELRQDGLELLREVSFPLAALDLHLFAESLASIAHLIYRHEPDVENQSAAVSAVDQLFVRRSIQPRRNFALEGKVEAKIRVDYYVEAERPLGLEVIRRRGAILDYMEQWGWRWRDLRDAHPTLIRGMVYDPALQDITSTIRRIGESVCEIFCPYYEARELDAVIDQAVTFPPQRTRKEVRDNPNVGSEPDRSTINMHEDYEVEYWMNKFGVSKERLQKAVNAVGKSAAQVQQWLNAN